MSKLGAVLKDEISRLGRKEAKASTGPLKRRILALEKLVREQRLALKQLAQRVASASRAAVHKVGKATEPSAADGARLTARSIKALRKRLRLSQTEFAKLTGVTHVAVYLWESGKTSPRGASREALMKARQLGVREARRRVDELPTRTRTRARRRKKTATKKGSRRA
jgi:DNA-binding transcriptional regulator YiaG